MKKNLLAILLALIMPYWCSAVTARNVYLHINKAEIIEGERVKIYGYVKPKSKSVKVRIYAKVNDSWKYLATKTTKKKGRFTHYANPEKDTYYRAKIKIKNKWVWGNKKKFVNVELYPECGDQYDWFSANVMDEGVYHSISPLGATNPSGHTFPTDHIYFYLNDAVNAYSVYAPGDMYVESITAQEHLSADPVYTDYSLSFHPCAEFHNFFMHISGLSADLKTAYDQIDSSEDDCMEYTAGGNEYRICTKDIRYKATAGEIIGTAGSNEGQNALDWGAYDTRTEISGVANENRFYEQTLYNVCPLDYYDATTKNYLYGYLGYADERRTVEPLCGTINQDMAGTAQGRWFLAGTDENDWQEDHQLALIHDNVNFSRGIFSVGDATDSLATGEYEFTPADSYYNLDFDEVTDDGQIHCYHTYSAIVLIQLTSDTTLRLESQDLESCNTSPWNFTDNYTDFER